ncbi:glycosyltransferase family 4 protein [Porifericola rhodea]|uniref:glycosyltransferase family 4 protein n=1 Tax=Porifericola rhodea TaxID=930972 RepID=UPI00266596B1|nr:glycosyltransferase family 4 protein [Porifericola rhodea]WKN30487.1 glycosyltransferase family 4 protein [Porifericola rhodea]
MEYKILVLTPDLRVPGGVSNYYETLKLEEVAEVEYFFVSPEKDESLYGVVWRMLTNYIAFIKLLRKGNIKLVHINPSLNLKSFIRDGLYVILSHLLRKKTLVFFHGWSDEFELRIHNKSYLKFFFNHSFKRCKDIIVLSDSFRRKLISLGCSESHTKFWIETTVADTSFLEGFSLEEKITTYKKLNHCRILFLSRIEETKGVFITINAFKKLQDDLPDKSFELIIAGDGSALNDAKKVVEEQRVPNVTFTGYVRGEGKGIELHKAHIFLFPTYYGEGMPTNILEGMLYGMPIVSRYNAGIADSVGDGENGFLTESKEPSVFTDMLKKIVQNPELYERMVRINHKKALENFASENVRERILKIYQTIIER